MKLKATSIFLGLCLAVIVSAASLAHAQNGFAQVSGLPKCNDGIVDPKPSTLYADA